jgi:tryptophan synthase alpha chain
MNRIDEIFARLRTQGRGAVMPFVCGGHPDPGATARILPALCGAGASVLEVGIPFSDPIADGPVIAAAMHEALCLGATPDSVLGEVSQARAQTSAGVVAMVSISLVHSAGEAAFVQACAAAGVDGLIVPDLPLEESGHLRNVARNAGLTFSLLVAPTTPPARAERIAAACTGFVYLLARSGVTGEGASIEAAGLRTRVEALRQVTDLPIACGFGISGRDQVREVLGIADAAIVGSALVRRMSDAHANGADPIGAGAAFVSELCQAAACAR